MRELVMVGRLPESWIAPDHILDLRARVRLRHTLIDERGECQQRIHAVLYHHGCPHHHGIGLLSAKYTAEEGRGELVGAFAELLLPEVAVALSARHVA